MVIIIVGSRTNEVCGSCFLPQVGDVVMKLLNTNLIVLSLNIGICLSCVPVDV